MSRFACHRCGWWLDHDGIPCDGPHRCECWPRFPVRHCFRGDTFVFDLTVRRIPPGSPPGTPAAPIDITGWFMWWTVKRTYTDADLQAVSQATSTPTSTPAGGGIVFTLAQAGKAEITMGPLATRAFPDGTSRLVYDVQIMDPQGHPFTVERGYLLVEADVTNAIQHP